MGIEELSASLGRDAEGVYRAGGSHEVSYAEHGHEECLNVEDRSFWFRHRNDCIASLVTNHPYRGPLLDIGGGNGYVAKRLADEGREVVLLEPGEAGARNARRVRGLQNVVCATLQDAGFRPGSFGALGLFDVIEHIEDDRGFLAQARDVLAADGRLYLTVPCHQWLWSGADVHAGHFRRHTRASLEAMLDGMFRIDYISGFFRPLVAPLYLLRALPYRLGLGRDNSLLSTEAEHGSGDGLATQVMTHLLQREHAQIARNRAFGLGLAPSCLLAATRI